MANEKEILEQAKNLIIKKQYQEARQLLLPIKNNPTAQKWLEKLDEIAPVKIPEPPPPPSNEIPEPVSRFAPPPLSDEIPEPISPIRTIQPPPARPAPAMMEEEDETEFESVEQLRPQPKPIGLEAEAPEDRARFERVKEIFSQAQMVLREMPGNKRAHRWSRRLDNIDRPVIGERFFEAEPGTAPQQRFAHFINESKSAQTRNDLRNFLYSDTFRYVVGGMALFAAVMTLLGFFIFNWVELGTNDMTPLQIWLGTNDTYPTLDLTKFGDDDLGFGDVRLIDRLLILILPLAIGLGAVAVLYLQKKLPMRTALLALTATAFLLLIFGFFWRTLSTSAWKGDIKEQYNYEDLSDSEKSRADDQIDEQLESAKSSYSTGEHELYSFLAFAVAFGGLVLLFADERGLLDEDYL